MKSSVTAELVSNGDGKSAATSYRWRCVWVPKVQICMAVNGKSRNFESEYLKHLMQ